MVLMWVASEDTSVTCETVLIYLEKQESVVFVIHDAQHSSKFFGYDGKERIQR